MIDIELLDCPRCQGPAIFEEAGGWCCYVTCADCGCHTAEIPYDKDTTPEDAAKKVANLWNRGKVISHDPGE